MSKKLKNRGDWLRTFKHRKIELPDDPESRAAVLRKLRDEDRQNRDFERIMADQRALIVRKLKAMGYIQPKHLASWWKWTDEAKNDGFWLSDAFDSHPIESGLEQQLGWIKEAQAAIARGDIKTACYAAYRFGLAEQEVVALDSYKRFFAKEKGSAGPLKSIYFDAKERIAKPGGKEPSLNAIKFEMKKDPAGRCRQNNERIEYKDTNGAWKPLPKRFKSTASEWDKEARTRADTESVTLKPKA